MQYTPLFESEHLRLTPIDPENDAQMIASWTYALEIARRLREDQPARPMPVIEVKKVTEKWQKEAEENQKQFLFAVRKHALAGNAGKEPIIGMVRIKQIEWVHGAAYLDLILGDSQDWQAYARETLDLTLRYAFDELSLFRVTVVIEEHNQAARQLYEQANFTLEVRQRQAIYWNKRTWDTLYYGMLRPEWKMLQAAEVSA